MKGFTLMELLIVLGIIGILTAIVLVAINPTKQLNDARNAYRTSGTVQLENATSQYIIDGNTLTGLPTSKETAKPICRESVTGTDCTNPPVSGIDLSVLTPTYIVALPVDEKETDPSITGFRIYLNGTIIKICSDKLDGSCGS